MTHLADQIRGARTLGQLYDALCNWDGCECHDCENVATDLPTYGGSEPSNTREIYSWDRTRFLLADEASPGGWQLVERDVVV